MVVRATVDAATARQDFLERDFAYQRLVREHANVKLVNAQLREKVEVSAAAATAQQYICTYTSVMLHALELVCSSAH
jgi:hypothetical protein